jgi:hypothetical protein
LPAVEQWLQFLGELRPNGGGGPAGPAGERDDQARGLFRPPQALHVQHDDARAREIVERDGEGRALEALLPGLLAGSEVDCAVRDKRRGDDCEQCRNLAHARTLS